MEKLRILIADRDREFARALGRAISGAHPDIRITEKTAEEVFGKGGQPAVPQRVLEEWDLILGDEADCAAAGSRKVMGLCDRSQSSPERDGCLYRYAGVSALVTAIRIRCEQLGAPSFVQETSGGRQAQWISFYSAAGGSGKTAAALGIARYLALEKNSRILYLSLEEPDATSFYFGKNTALTHASQLLYYFEEWRDRGEFASKALPFLQKDDCGVEALAGGEGRNEFAHLNRKEMETLLSSLRDMNRFEYIFVDLPGGFFELPLFVLSQSDKVIFVESGTGESRYKTRQAEAFLDRLWEGGGPKRMRVQSDSAGQGEMTELVQGAFYLPYDPDSFIMEDHRMRIGVHKKFGRGAAQIAEQLEWGWDAAAQ